MMAAYDKNGFGGGVYKVERANMDYSYHPRYDLDPVRAAVQDKIVTNLLSQSKAASSDKWLTYMCGGYGSGKSHSFKALWSNYISLNGGAIYIDPDAIKPLLEPTATAAATATATATAAAATSSDGKTADKNTQHMEATFVALLAEKAAIRRGMSAVVDGSLHDYEWYELYLKELRLTHPEYKLCLVKVNCDLKTALERCESRAKITKRSIPSSKVTLIFDKLPISFVRLQPLFDCIIIIDNHISPTISQIQCCSHPPPFVSIK
jgi:hypothetical protein